VLKGNAWYFTNPEEVARHLNGDFYVGKWEERCRKNVSRIRDNFNWRIIVEQYEVAMQQIII
jgi:hypothetical protein